MWNYLHAFRCSSTESQRDASELLAGVGRLLGGETLKKAHRLRDAVENRWIFPLLCLTASEKLLNVGDEVNPVLQYFHRP